MTHFKKNGDKFVKNCLDDVISGEFNQTSHTFCIISTQTLSWEQCVLWLDHYLKEQ